RSWKIRGVRLMRQLTDCFSLNHHRLPQGPAATFLLSRNLVRRATTDDTLLRAKGLRSSGAVDSYDFVIGQLNGCTSVNPHCQLFCVSRNHIRRALRPALAD